MAAYYQSPISAWFQGFTAQGIVLQSGKLYTYLAGTTTPQATYTDGTSVIANANPIILGTDGRPANEVWIPTGLAVKFILQDSNSNVLATWDNVSGMNDVAAPAASEWQASGYTTGTGLAYSSATRFTVTTATDLTATGTSQIFAAGRRVQATVTAGTSYATITSSSFGAGVNTVNVDTSGSIALDSGLSAVSYGILNPVNTSVSPDAANSKGTALTSATSTAIWTSGGDWVHITGTTAITSFGTAAKAGQFRKLTFDGALLLTNGSNLVLPGGINIPTAAGDTALVVADTTSKAVVVNYTKASGAGLLLPRGYIDGFTLSTAGGSATMSIAAGQADDSTHAYAFNGTAFTKTQSAWAAGTGNGGLGSGSGAVANAKWFHWYAIYITATGTVDFLFSDEYPTPTLPGTASKFRYIGSWTTSNAADSGGASTNWSPWVQYGDEFWVNTIAQDFTTATQTATNQSVRVPPGLKVRATVQVKFVTSGSVNTNGGRMYGPDQADVAIGNTSQDSIAFLFGPSTVTPVGIAGTFQAWTNTTQQIVTKSDQSSITITGSTLGYFNPRGRNS